MKINFDCPTCGHNKLVEVLEDVIMESVITEMSHIDSSGDEDGFVEVAYGDSNTNLGDIMCFACDNCGDKIYDENNDIIISPEELYLWLKNNEMLDENNQEVQIDEESESTNTKIIIEVSGGLVQNISNIPNNIEIEVRDYDVDGRDEDPDFIFKDDNGDKYFRGIWDNK